MKLRKQNGLPTNPPHQGEGELIFESGLRQLHARTNEQGRTTVVGSFERGAGTDGVQQNVKTLRGAGQITLTNGSATITGDGKDDLTADGTEETLGWWYQIIVDGVAYEINTIPSATTATLSSAWAGATQTVDLVFRAGPAATGEAAVATGQATQATGARSQAGGTATLASGSESLAHGNATQATASHSAAFGKQSIARRIGEVALANGQFAAAGDAQRTSMVLLGTTSNNSVRRLGQDGVQSYQTIQDDRVCLVKATVAARNTGANEYAAYELTALVKRDTGAGTTALVGSVGKTVLQEDVAGWDATIAVDTGQGSFDISVTGENSKTIRWVAFVEVVEVG